MQKIFRGRFPGHSGTIHHRQQAKRKPAIIRTPSPRPIRTNANMTEHIRPKASATYPARDHQKTDTQSRRKGPAPLPTGKARGAFQVAADHADKGRPAGKLYAHARTHQHNTHAEHRHTQRHTPKKKPPDCQPEKHTPRHPGESGKHQTPANASKRKHQNPKHGPPAGDSIHRARAHPDQFPRARARKGTARAVFIICGLLRPKFS